MKTFRPLGVLAMLNADAKLISEFFDVGNVEVQMSRHRFVMAGVPSESERWERCKAEYRLIKNAQAYDDVPGSLSSSEGAK